MVTSPYEYDILKRDAKQYSNKRTSQAPSNTLQESVVSMHITQENLKRQFYSARDKI